ncbi:ATP-dependent helicase HrpB [Pseudidiomarina marina]|uniref:ATP-dependent helicase HrpB n=1 Tax=Pseudidiomarina marina TaxID=502366 RepID=A0A432YDI8_9GAMM|nr:ATP-dependent helicase HrpB [Pseudidiomarina marina]RUO58926.1 ATP-dependent helicase HrpB [Pseudidiomarina marina]
MTTPQVLPVTALIDDVIRLLPSAPVVLEAPPGAGKSTALPLALMQSELFQQQRILLLQPRRMAALSIAHFLAEQLGEAVGESVGYHIRGEAKFNAQTRLLVVTEGMFTQYIQRDPELLGTGLIIFDEFHERNLATDLGLAMALESASLRDDLRLLIMSATLPAQTIANWLGDAHVLQSEGRQYPINIQYQPVPANQTWLQAMPAVIREAMRLASKGVLVFVPGKREIDQLSAMFEGNSEWLVMPLHRQIPLAQQKQVLDERDTRRRLVISTNIAETSVTIPNIDVVVDSGRERQAQFYPQHGITKLVTSRISKASATQRAGRAGRLGPGHCFRLWAQADEHGLRDYQAPELETADLTSFLLECRRWGSSPEQLKFFSLPNRGNLAQANSVLKALELCNEQGMLTALGHQVADLGTEPRLATLLVRAKTTSATHAATAAWLVAQLEHNVEANQFPLPVERLTQTMRQRYQYWCKQLELTQPRVDASLCSEVLLWGFPDRVAKLRANSDRYLLSNGAGAMLHQQDTRSRDDWLLVLDMTLSEHHRDAIIRTAIPLNNTDLEHPAIIRERRVEVRWQGPQQRLQALEVDAIGAIVLREIPQPDKISSEQRLHALGNYVKAQMRERGLELFQLSPATQQWLARVRLYEKLQQPTEWPSIAIEVLVDSIEQWAEPYWQSIDSLSKLHAWDPLPALQARLTFQQQQQLDEACPAALAIPSGRLVAIDYCAEKPKLSAKLQELFGEPVSPTICNGRQSITIDLLSPAGRLLQRTADLASFWKNAYQHVKKEMKGRYPKHPWPDDPLQAQATHKTKRQLK